MSQRRTFIYKWKRSYTFQQCQCWHIIFSVGSCSFLINRVVGLACTHSYYYFDLRFTRLAYTYSVVVRVEKAIENAHATCRMPHSHPHTCVCFCRLNHCPFCLHLAYSVRLDGKDICLRNIIMIMTWCVQSPPTQKHLAHLNFAPANRQTTLNTLMHPTNLRATLGSFTICWRLTTSTKSMSNFRSLKFVAL